MTYSKNPVYELSKKLEEQRQAIFSDKNLSPEAKERLLKMMVEK
jgi:DNA-binding TFAR19-related protein (PDSD5 family)